MKASLHPHHCSTFACNAPVLFNCNCNLWVLGVDQSNQALATGMPSNMRDFEAKYKLACEFQVDVECAKVAEKAAFILSCMFSSLLCFLSLLFMHQMSGKHMPLRKRLKNNTAKLLAAAPLMPPTNSHCCKIAAVIALIQHYTLSKICCYDALC